jgi:hypothetical protein
MVKAIDRGFLFFEQQITRIMSTLKESEQFRLLASLIKKYIIKKR